MQAARAESVRLTYADFVGFPDDGRRHELIDGEHYVTPSPLLRHQELSARLLVAFRIHLQAHSVGHAYAGPLDVILSDHDVVEPDLLFVSNERREVLRDWVHGAPDLVIEILSPSSRRTDEVTKRHLYERSGVREYWIVDAELEMVKVFRRAPAGGFGRAVPLTREDSDVLDTPLLPGLSVPLAALFG